MGWPWESKSSNSQVSSQPSSGGSSGGFDAGSQWGAIVGNYLGQREANKANKQIAADNRNWQQAMSNSAHTREVIDLRMAGLNPILSATGGSGASTPAGNVAQMENEVSGAISSALDATRMKSEIKAVNSQADLNVIAGEAAKASALKDINSAKNSALVNTMLEADLPSKLKHSEYNKNLAPLDAVIERVHKAGQAMPKINLNLGPKSSDKTSPKQRDSIMNQLR